MAVITLKIVRKFQKWYVFVGLADLNKCVQLSEIGQKGRKTTFLRGNDFAPFSLRSHYSKSISDRGLVERSLEKHVFYTNHVRLTYVY